MTELDNIFDDISINLKTRFDLVISICNSPIEKLFIAKLYRFFYLRHFAIDLLTYDAQELLLKKVGAEGYNPDHEYYKIDSSVGQFKHPLYGMMERVSGILIE